MSPVIVVLAILAPVVLFFYMWGALRIANYIGLAYNPEARVVLIATIWPLLLLAGNLNNIDSIFRYFGLSTFHNRTEGEYPIDRH